MFGQHPIRSWNSTRSTICLSSVNAEHDALVNVAGIGLGVQEYLRDLGVETQLRVHTDPISCNRHHEDSAFGNPSPPRSEHLMVQSKLRSKAFELHNVNDNDNPANLFAKHLVCDNMSRCLKIYWAPSIAMPGLTLRRNARTINR